MVAPDFVLYKNVSWLVFSRLRPVHTNDMIFGFVGSALMGAMYYFVPHLVRTPLHSRAVGRLTLWLWNIAIAAGDITLMAGYSQSREYAEWIWPVDILVLIAFALTFYNIFKTVAQRKETLLYVSVWYAFAAMIFTWFIYFFGNAVWHPGTGAITGMADGDPRLVLRPRDRGSLPHPACRRAFLLRHPHCRRAPLFSHTLSLVGFWSILMFYPHIGTHHLLQTPTPTWLKVVAVTGSVGMLIPVITVLVNLWLTMKGRLASIHADIGGKWVFAGLVWYLFVCFQGAFQSLPSCSA